MTSLGTKGRTVTQAVQTEREKVIKARENKSGKHKSHWRQTGNSSGIVFKTGGLKGFFSCICYQIIANF